MKIRRFMRDEQGLAAVEFAVLAPAFIMLLVGTMTMSILLFTSTSLHFATAEAARCASVRTTVCTDASSTVTYAAAHYYGSARAAAFTCTGRVCGGTAACGNRVVGTVTMTLDVGLASYSTPLSSTACYP